MIRPVLVSFARTPIAKFRGSLSSLKAPELGALATRAALERTGSSDIEIKEAFLGNVVSAGIGQAPCRQAVLGAGLPNSVVCTTINKVCASGMKSVMLASQKIQCGGLTKATDALLAGGFESMSNIPHYLMGSRSGTALGHTQLIDGVIHDGLWDVYNNQHMGNSAEICSQTYGISRQDQDAFAIESYKRAQKAIADGVFESEIVSVEVPQRRADPIVVDTDEEPHSVNMDKLSTLRPAFSKDGTVTAANASSLNDGAAAMVLMAEDAALNLGLKPLARILGYGDAAQDPVQFTTSPALAVPVAADNAKIDINDIEYHEINEAFSVVALANIELLKLDADKVNVFGGAVALGHPIGMSGARIIGSLYNVLKQKDSTIGCASICNGGGGASAIVIERLS